MKDAGIGIDLGSSAVRVGLYSVEDDSVLGYVKKQVSYYCHEEPSLWEYTQSTNEIMAAIESCFKELRIEQYNVRSCGVSATCSLAIFQKHDDNLLPFDEFTGKGEQNVVFWMDSTSKQECMDLNDSSDQFFKDMMGGSFIPEMAIPKLLRIKKFLKDKDVLSNKSIIVMDLHRFIAYEIAKSQGWNFQQLVNTPNANGVGHDGELSGWSPSFYKDVIEVPRNVVIGPECEISDGKEEKNVKVVSCIDCYSSWFSLCSSNLMRSLFIVGGTSTCFLKVTRRLVTIPGVWGPFTDILDGHCELGVYEGGQSCSGRLIEHLLASHPATSSIPKVDWPSLLEKIERKIVQIEHESGHSIHVKTKHMFYYGDLQGNRTPFADPSMSGSFIGESTDVSFANLVYRYICILEFLAFQVKYIVSIFNSVDQDTKIEEIRMCGSQAKNRRLLTLIYLINKGISIKLPAASVDLTGVHGAYLMGKCAMADKDVAVMIENKGMENGVENFSTDLQPSKSLLALLETKYEIHLDMAKQQIKYREAVDETLRAHRSDNVR